MMLLQKMDMKHVEEQFDIQRTSCPRGHSGDEGDWTTSNQDLYLRTWLCAKQTAQLVKVGIEWNFNELFKLEQQRANLPCVYLNWQIKLLSHFQTTREDIVDEALISYANGLAG